MVNNTILGDLTQTIPWALGNLQFSLACYRHRFMPNSISSPHTLNSTDQGKFHQRYMAMCSCFPFQTRSAWQVTALLFSLLLCIFILMAHLLSGWQRKASVCCSEPAGHESSSNWESAGRLRGAQNLSWQPWTRGGCTAPTTWKFLVTAWAWPKKHSWQQEDPEVIAMRPQFYTHLRTEHQGHILMQDMPCVSEDNRNNQSWSQKPTKVAESGCFVFFLESKFSSYHGFFAGLWFFFWSWHHSYFNGKGEISSFIMNWVPKLLRERPNDGLGLKIWGLPCPVCCHRAVLNPQSTGQSRDSWQRWTGGHYKERGESCSSQLDKGALNYLKCAEDIY